MVVLFYHREEIYAKPKSNFQLLKDVNSFEPDDGSLLMSVTSILSQFLLFLMNYQFKDDSI